MQNFAIDSIYINELGFDSIYIDEPIDTKNSVIHTTAYASPIDNLSIDDYKATSLATEIRRSFLLYTRNAQFFEWNEICNWKRIAGANFVLIFPLT